jgi:hypothetical protein
LGKLNGGLRKLKMTLELQTERLFANIYQVLRVELPDSMKLSLSDGKRKSQLSEDELKSFYRRYRSKGLYKKEKK